MPVVPDKMDGQGHEACAQNEIPPESGADPFNNVGNIQVFDINLP